MGESYRQLIRLAVGGVTAEFLDLVREMFFGFLVEQESRELFRAPIVSVFVNTKECWQ